MIIGDLAYPILPWLLKGYTKSFRLSPEEESFNEYLSSGRVCVEIAFGRLKARWRCLLKRLDIHFTFVAKIVTVCCILHNIVETKKETFQYSWLQAVEETNLHLHQPSHFENRERPNFDGSTCRDVMKEFLAENFPLRKTFHA